MTDLYPNINFPKVDFSSLGDLPAIAERVAGQQSMQRALADLTPESDALEMAKKLEAAATRIYSSNPSAEGLAQATQLMTQAKNLRDIKIRDEANKAYEKYAPGIIAATGRVYGPPASATGTEGTATVPTPIVGAPGAVPAPDPFAGPPASINTIIPPALRAPPGPSGELTPPILSPSDQVIQSAQQGRLPPITPPATAALGSAADVGAPPVAPPAAPPPVQMAGGPQQLPFMGGMPNVPPSMALPPVTNPPPPSPPGPGTPAGPPSTTVPSVGAPSALPSLRSQMTPEDSAALQGIVNEMARGGPHMGSSQRQALQMSAQAIMNRYNLAPGTNQWYQEQLERARAGDPLLSFGEWSRRKEGLHQILEASNKTYEGYSASGKSAADMLVGVQALKGIVNNPQFVSGADAEKVGDFGRAISTIASTARAYGISNETISSISQSLGLGKNFEVATDPAKLHQAFTQLKNMIVYDRLGSLSRQISDGDREFVNRMGPDILNTVEGNKLAIKLMEAMAKRNVDVAKQVRDYKIRNETTATAAELDDVAYRAKESNSIFFNKDGSQTDLYKELVGYDTKEKAAGRGGFLGAVTGAIEGIPGAVAAGKEAAGSVAGTLGNVGRAITGTTVSGTLIPPSISVTPGPTSESVTPQDSGKLFYDADGKPAGLIKNGVPVPFSRLQRSPTLRMDEQ